MQYKLVTDSEFRAEQEVNRLLKEGWELLGPPSMTIREGGRDFQICQAMTKK